MGRSSVYHRLGAARGVAAPSLWRGRIVLGRTRMLGRREDGPAVYTYEAVPGVPPMSTIRFGWKPSPGEPPRHAHSHDFLVPAYLERGGGSMWGGDREWRIEPGDVYVIPAGEKGGVGQDASSLHEAEGYG